MNIQKSQRILVVDDSVDNIQVLMKLLMDDYKVVAATSGAQAITLAAGDPQPDIILLDIMMPEMDGYEVCRRLKSDGRTKKIPIIFVSALDGNNDEFKGLELGAVDYLTKPIVPNLAKARVDNHLVLKKYQDKLEYLSLHDDLTGLYNTRYLYNKLHEFFSSDTEEPQLLSTIFMDMDNFKYVVDTYGHLNGSQAIREVGRTILDVVEAPCYGVAYGGDEFVVVLPGFNKAQAREKASSIQQIMRQTRYLQESGCDISLSCSFGISTTTNKSGNIRSLLSEADSQLFEVKRTGKGLIGVA